MTRSQMFTRTILVWLLVVVISETARIALVLTGPPDSDLYVNHLDFQLVASAFLIVTRWVPTLFGVLLLEATGFQVRARFKT